MSSKYRAISKLVLLQSSSYLSELGTEPDIFFKSGAGFEFLGKIRIRYEWYGVYNVCKSMAEMGTEPDPEPKIWRLTGSGFLVFGAGSGSQFF